MGFGDEIMATGMARRIAKLGKRAAFGDGKKIIWGPWAEPIFRSNPKIARPGEEEAADLEWVTHYKGRRLYNKLSPGRWVWNLSFHAEPGELFFDDREKALAASFPSGFVLVEPNVPREKSVAPNKDWGFDRYQAVADRLRMDGHVVAQFRHGLGRLRGAELIGAVDFRTALVILSRAALYIGPEGGLHHGAAAVSVPGVVLFGGFIPPSVTGYPTHTNLTGGAQACGLLTYCPHCQAAMRAIQVGDVYSAAKKHLGET